MTGSRLCQHFDINNDLNNCFFYVSVIIFIPHLTLSPCFMAKEIGTITQVEIKNKPSNINNLFLPVVTVGSLAGWFNFIVIKRNIK